MSKNVIVLLAISFVVRLLLGLLFPLTADESYYWLWSKHLSLSYVDHPPMVAYINFLFTFGKEFLFGIRLASAIILLLISTLTYYIARETFDERVAFWSTLLLNLVPHFLVIWLTMFVEVPLGLFWLLSIYLLLQIIKTNKNINWYLMGISVGLGILSKYTMLIFWPCLALFILLSPDHRCWLKEKKLYLSIIISMLFLLPILLWNSYHGWVSFAYHGTKLAAHDALGANLLSFIADQLVHFSPFILFALIPAYLYAFKKDAKAKLLFCFSAPILLLMLLLSFKVKIWAHWPAIGYLTAIILIVAKYAENPKALHRFMLWVGIFTLLILNILFWLTPAILLHQDAYHLNYRLAQLIPQNIKIFTKTNVSASLLEFYLKRPVYLATGSLKIGRPWGEKQYELWGIPNLKPGEDIVYFGENTKEFQALASTCFKGIAPMTGIKLSLVEDYITNNFGFYKLNNYQGKTGHP